MQCERKHNLYVTRVRSQWLCQEFWWLTTSKKERIQKKKVKGMKKNWTTSSRKHNNRKMVFNLVSWRDLERKSAEKSKKKPHDNTLRHLAQKIRYFYYIQLYNRHIYVVHIHLVEKFIEKLLTLLQNWDNFTIHTAFFSTKQHQCVVQFREKMYMAGNRFTLMRWRNYPSLPKDGH